jgi:hypothetical protein
VAYAELVTHNAIGGIGMNEEHRDPTSPIRVTVEAKDDRDFAFERRFEAAAPDGLEVALGDAAEELLEAGIDPSGLFRATLTAEDASTGRTLVRRRWMNDLRESGIRTEMRIMGRDLAMALREPKWTPSARIEIENLGEAWAESSSPREVLMSLREQALGLWTEASEPPPSVRVRLTAVTEIGVHDADFSAADAGELSGCLQSHIYRFWHEAEMARLDAEREEEAARREAEREEEIARLLAARVGTKEELLAEARAHPDWDAFLSWCDENEAFVDSYAAAAREGAERGESGTNLRVAAYRHAQHTALEPSRGIFSGSTWGARDELLALVTAVEDPSLAAALGVRIWRTDPDPRLLSFARRRKSGAGSGTDCTDADG